MRSTTRDTGARIAAIPATAEVRAVFLRVISSALPEEAFVSWVSRFGQPPRAYTMIPVRDYIERVAAAALLSSGSLGAGLAQIHARAVGFLLAQPGMELFLSARDRHPVRLFERLESSRSLIASYGDWRVTLDGRQGATIVVRDEYIWLDLLWTPLLSSIFPACGVQGEIECDLDGPFSGRLRARW
ncbi:MAG: hypothetical protein ACXWUE_07895 [Polyangiales bacterium]